MSSPTGDDSDAILDTGDATQDTEERRERLRIGRRVAAAREDQRLSQEQVSARANISRSSVQAAERGEASRRTLQRIAAALGTDVDRLTGQPPPAATSQPGPTGLAAATTADLVAELHRRIVTAPTAGDRLRIVAEDGRGWDDLNAEDQAQLRRAIDAATRQSDDPH